MKIKCLIVEDEPKAMKLLQEYVEQVDFLDLLFSFSDPVDALNYSNNNSVDLIFLDINLPAFSGLELAALLKAEVKIIFTTAYSQYAAQSYEHNTTDYLLKPITFARFLKAVQKVKNEQPKNINLDGKENDLSNTFFVKSGKKIIPLQWSNLYLLEGMKEYVLLITATSKTIVYKRMKDFEAIIPSDFTRIHNSFIINNSFIQRIEDNHVYILDKAIPIGKKYKESFYEKLNDKFI
ncbi:LytR/AlgR family response regulator transcription factor [Aquiflexum sp.]|uniref:LytR/AlgR family response regulator transcription factor n=1 Tax=Aquiflexum sp. TaxID=1872584 RepID=UPI0035934D5C